MNNVLYFVAGVAIGSVATYFITKSSFAKKADEEIRSIREYYSSKEEKPGDTPDVVKEEISRVKPEMDAIIKNYASISQPKEEPKITPGHEPYVIDEEDFDELMENEDYDVLTSYRYYANGVLVNSRDEVVDMPTVAKFIGLGNLKQLSMQDDDIIWIRNDVHKCAYEIIREDEDYIDPHIEG